MNIVKKTPNELKLELFDFIKEYRVFAEENTMSTRVPYRVIGVEINDDGIFFKYDTGRSY